jgi:acetylornithine deacetylase/succinyl-diaminopimelate desuccinylase-like protein
VLARMRSGPAAVTSASTPAILIYGHLDVKQPGPGWTSDPFTPIRRGRRLVARGASDDKGQLMAHLVAVQAWSSVGGPPCDLVVVVDGAEEVGSPGLVDILTQIKRSGWVDGGLIATVVSDTRAVAPGVPSLTVSQRGMVGLTVTVDVGGTPVHAGRFGGAVVDPSAVLIRALGAASRTLSDFDGSTAAAQHPTDHSVRMAAGGRAVVSVRPAEKATTAAAMTVTSLRASASPGSIPTVARADLDVRIPPGVSPRQARSRLVAAITAHRAAGVSVRVTDRGSAPGSVLRHSPQVRSAVRAACIAGFGAAPVETASGGSIPAVSALKHAFGRAPILLGFGPPDDNAHGPDESLDLDDWAHAIDAAVVLIERLAEVRAPADVGPRRLRRGTTLVTHGDAKHQKVTTRPCSGGGKSVARSTWGVIDGIA